MKTNLTDADHDLLVRCFKRFGANGWEPLNPHTPFMKRVIEAGYLRRVDGRCGFERFKDSHVKFTEAGYNALKLADMATGG